MTKNILIGVGVFVLILTIILIVVFATRKPEGPESLTFPKEPVTLTYWRLFDSEDVFKPILSEYKSERSNVTINYVEKNYETYEEDLLNALAAGIGPDIFMLRSDWLPKHLDKLAPAPEGFSFVEQRRGEPKKDLPTQIKEYFVKAVSSDLIFDNKVYGIPLYVDSLALYYNPTLFDEALERYQKELGNEEGKEEEIQRIGNLLRKPPNNWTDFIEVVKLLTKKDGKGNIILAGAALGTAKNVAKAGDILSILMLQNNTQMVTADKKTAAFNLSIKKKSGELIYPGTAALDFYTSFARSNKETYTYSDNLLDSVSAFGQGQAAMMFHYSYWMPLLKKLYPELQFEIAPMLQIKGTTERVDYAYFWPEVVSKDTKYPLVAWDFLRFISGKDRAREYNRASQRPYSRLELAKEEAEGGFENLSGLSVYNGQALSAISWYKGGEPNKIDEVFQNMIGAVVEKGQEPQAAIDSASASVTNILGEAEPLIEREKTEP